jgi:hypothetical protein
MSSLDRFMGSPVWDSVHGVPAGHSKFPNSRWFLIALAQKVMETYDYGEIPWMDLEEYQSKCEIPSGFLDSPSSARPRASWSSCVGIAYLSSCSAERLLEVADLGGMPDFLSIYLRARSDHHISIFSRVKLVRWLFGSKPDSSVEFAEHALLAWLMFDEIESFSIVGPFFRTFFRRTSKRGITPSSALRRLIRTDSIYSKLAPEEWFLTWGGLFGHP